MSHTLDIEEEIDEEVETHSYVFTLKYDEDGANIDYFVDTSSLTTPDCHAAVQGARAAAKLTGKAAKVKQDFTAQQKALLHRVYFLAHLRPRFDGGTHGPYIVRTDYELEPDTLLAYLRNLTTEARKTFLEGAKL